MTGKERLNRLQDQRWQLLPSLLQRSAEKPERDHTSHLFEALGYLIQDNRLPEATKATVQQWLQDGVFDRLANRTAQWIEQYGYTMSEGLNTGRTASDDSGSLYRRVWTEWLSFIQKVIAARSSFDLFKAGNRLIPILIQGHRELDALFARPLPERSEHAVTVPAPMETPRLLKSKKQTDEAQSKPSWAWPLSKHTVFIPKRMMRHNQINPDTQTGY
ncbi:hypothetical protein [Chitinivorax sp. B]|uniref:hypothetical protein n=1 Tax=Chitinivorax sp. B TaxID=2502235 RepID=UPI0010F7B398|nr:hypothetical protein [Chitinivorax sp. B]